MEKTIENKLNQKYGKSLREAEDREVYLALLEIVREKMAERPVNTGSRKLYYISAEFLVGKLLSNHLINLGLFDEVRESLEKNGKHIGDIEEIEPEPSLGNGGLGRLAACFMDSMATLGLNGDGIGLNYHGGLFRQRLRNLKQYEEMDSWIEEEGWLEKTETGFEVPFRDVTVKSVMYDMRVPGYEKGCSLLHLFDLETVDDSLVTRGIHFEKKDIEKNLTLFLYPDDSDEEGRLLRIYQQYFMVSNAASLIIKETLERGADLYHLHEHVCIQINDTHPAMIIPELIRILTEKHGFNMDTAVYVVSKTCAYTNHTILAEALEKWPMAYMEKVVPALMPVIRELDQRVKRDFHDESVFIVDDKDMIHMAHMAIHFGYAVNGVAKLHTNILKESELHSFYRIYPEKFYNKTNGVTFRRWLLHCNEPLTKLISELIGEGYKRDAGKLQELTTYIDDRQVLGRLKAIKREAKLALKEEIRRTQGIVIDENAIFDIQIKRLHEYKRQQMNILYAIYKYKEIKKGNLPETPITMIFGAKAAPAYTIAKDIIHLILCLAELIRKDEKVSRYLKVVMVENYNVTWAEKLIPACDISEQISLAGKEASGTGNMKLMLNGAVTLGTEDGANVEIHRLVGDDNIYIFGEDSRKVISLYDTGAYSPAGIYDSHPEMAELVDFIISKEMIRLGDPVSLARLYKELVTRDWFMTLLDLGSYIETREKVMADYGDEESWSRKMLVNIAMSGFFSSDRTIEEYNRDIWKL